LRRFHRLGLLLVLAAATALRLHGVGFGLPALNDADEPLFMMTAFEMLQRHSLNPQWFGHPATTTLYCLMLVMVAMAGFGIASGRYADIAAFGSAAYVDPGLVWLPARLFFVCCGVACVYLTYRAGRRLGDERLGLVAALFLAVNPIHIAYSQVIRTDVQASLFMLLCLLSTLAIMREGKWRSYLAAGAFVGLSCATKWPAAIIALSPLAVGCSRVLRDRRELPRLVGFGLASAATLLIVSPYLLLDYPTVLRNLGSEARPYHPGATGGGFFANLGWYIAGPLLGSLGWGGLLLASLGLIWPRRGAHEWALAVLPVCAAYLAMISAESLRWERWLLPLLPFVALAAGRALCGIAELLRERLTGRRWPWAEAAAALLLAVPMVTAAHNRTVERLHDTRQMATAWLRANVPAGKTILVEHAGIDLLQGPWSFRYPLGSAGCVDARKALAGRISYSEVETRRRGSSVVDLAHVDPQRLPGCRSDFAVISHYDGYLDEQAHFEAEVARYRQVLRGARLRAVFRPEPGKSSGPVVRVVQF